MMNSSLHLHKPVDYSAADWHDSSVVKGVRFATRNISLGSRLALHQRLRDLLRQYEFLRAGDSLDNTEAHIADLLVRRLYLEWGLLALEGLSINGTEATVETLIELGPESLSNEIVDVVRASLELNEEERKNS